MKIELTVNGLKIQAQYQNEEIENVHKPLLHMLAALQTVNPQRRISPCILQNTDYPPY